MTPGDVPFTHLLAETFTSHLTTSSKDLMRRARLCATATGLLYILSLAQPTASFSFWFTNPPTQCANTTVQWGGGQPPFTLLLVPVGHLTPETRLIQEFAITAGFSVSFVLNFPAQSQFVAVLSDASGIGAGGTSRITTVAPSDVTSCLNTAPVAPKFYFHLSPTDIAQCSEIDISWDSSANPPVEVLALIPGGKSFEIANITDGGTQEVQWQADVRQGSPLLLVAGDADGLGSGGSTDVASVGAGDAGCIDDDSPGPTPGPPAGAVSTGVPGGEQTGEGGGGTSPTATDSNGNPITGGGVTGTQGSGQPGPTGGNEGGGSGNGEGGDGNGDGDGGNGSPTVTGSGGGTVTGVPDGSPHRNNSLPLIIGLVLGILALLTFTLGGILLYRRQKNSRAASYSNLEPASAPPSISSFPTAWQAWRHRSSSGPASLSPYRIPGNRRWFSFNWAAHLRGGVPSSRGESTETLPSMFQTEPFILPPPLPVSVRSAMSNERDHPFTPPPPGAYDDPSYAPTSTRRPDNIAAMSRSSSSGGRSMRSFLNSMPHAWDASVLDVDDTTGPIVAGLQHHPPSSYAPALRNANTSSESGAAPALTPVTSSSSTDEKQRSPRPTTRRTPSGRHTIVIPAAQALPPPPIIASPTRVTRDSEDFSPEPEEASPNPFGEDVVEIPPTYHSVRAVSMRGRGAVPVPVPVPVPTAEPGGTASAVGTGSGAGARLSRSNALSSVSRTRRARTLSTVGGASAETHASDGAASSGSADASAGHCS